jgi:hypothetical protein
MDCWPVALSAATIDVQLTFGGIEQQAIYYAPAGIEEDEPVRFALQADAPLPTGRYAWQAEVTERYIDGTQVVRVIAGHQAIVNLTDSNFGRRVWLNYLDRLVVQDDRTNRAIHCLAVRRRRVAGGIRENGVCLTGANAIRMRRGCRGRHEVPQNCPTPRAVSP